MRITLRNLALLGVAYVAGYVKGQQDGDKLAAALKDVGEGLKVMAKEIGVEVATREKNADAIDVEEIVVDEVKDTGLIEEQVIALASSSDGFTKTNEEIARELDISEDEVVRILLNANPPGEDPNQPGSDAT